MLPTPLRKLCVLLALAPMIAACENGATAYMIEGSQHALILVREQPYFWDGAVKQALIASRLPNCQRRVDIHPDRTDFTPMEVYEAGDRLWGVRQGKRWYLVSTEKCVVQDWDNAGGALPGPAVGVFRVKDGVATFVPAGQ